MINITFPDGSVALTSKGITALSNTENISPRLAKESWPPLFERRNADLMISYLQRRIHQFTEYGTMLKANTLSGIFVTPDGEALRSPQPSVFNSESDRPSKCFYYDVDPAKQLLNTAIWKTSKPKCGIVCKKNPSFIRKDISKQEAWIILPNAVKPTKWN